MKMVYLLSQRKQMTEEMCSRLIQLNRGGNFIVGFNHKSLHPESAWVLTHFLREQYALKKIIFKILCLCLLAHLEHFAPAQLMPWSVVHSPSSLAFHIFDISSRTISWFGLKLSGRQHGDLESAILGILRFFK